MKVKSFQPKNTTQCPCPGLEPGPLALEANARIIRCMIRDGLRLGKVKKVSEGKNVSMNIDQNTRVRLKVR